MERQSLRRKNHNGIAGWDLHRSLAMHVIVMPSHTTSPIQTTVRVLRITLPEPKSSFGTAIIQNIAPTCGVENNTSMRATTNEETGDVLGGSEGKKCLMLKYSRSEIPNMYSPLRTAPSGGKGLLGVVDRGVLYQVPLVSVSVRPPPRISGQILAHPLDISSRTRGCSPSCCGC
jgi:hypothetical protein